MSSASPGFQWPTARWAAGLLGGYAIAAGLLTLLGWWWELRRLTDWFGNGISMLPNAAIAAASGGMALVALAARRRRLALVPALLMLGVGAAVGLEHLTGVDLGIDRLVLYRPWGQNATYVPGRIGVPASLSFTVLGVAILLAAGARRGNAAATVGGMLATGVAMLSLLGYLFQADTLYSLPRLTTIALQTATMVLALSVGLVLTVRDEAIRTLERSAAGALVRRTLPFVIALPVVLGWLSLQGQAAGLFDPAFGTAILVLALIGLLGLLLWRTARAVGSHEQSLRQSRQRLEGVLASIGDGFQVLDRDWRYAYFNSAARRMLAEQGMDADRMLGRSVLDVFPGYAASPGWQALERAKSQAEDVQYESYFEPWQKWFAVRASPTPDGGVSILSQDITDRRGHADRLRESEERIQLAMSIADAATWDEDLLSHTLQWSDSHFSMLGYTPTPDRLATAQMWHDAVHPDDREKVRIERERAPAHDDMFAVEYRFLNVLTGATIWVNAAGRFFHDDDGRPVRFVGVLYEITERKRHEDELRRLAADLREADQSKDEFLASLAHELRNPLAPMSSALAAMKLAEGDAALRGRARDIIERQLRQMTRLIDDLLDVSRITRGKLELRRETVDLSSVVAHAVETSRPLADAAGVDIQVQLMPVPVHLHADPARLAQVFSNLLNNGCKYNRRGGQVWLTVTRQGDDVAVSVRDDGIGIPAEVLPRIFAMFFQAGTALERSHGGLGIGLTLVQRLVEMHEGSVVASSPGPGRGAEFIVRLPVVAAPVPARLVPSAPGRGQSPGRQVLVVDDNLDAANTLSVLLEMLGHTTRMAHDGDTAVELAASFKPHLIFLDIGLPGRNGYDVCRAIRQQPDGADITIVALTGWGQDQDRRSSRSAGFDGHLVKPVEVEVLMPWLDADTTTACPGSL